MVITETQARDLARLHLANCEDPVEVVSVEPCEFGWIVYYQSSVYLRSRRDSDKLAGNAPLLIEESSGKVTPLGTSQPLTWYLANLSATGNPHTELGLVVEITGWDEGAAVVSAVQSVRALCQVGLLTAKRVIESSLAWEKPRLCARNAEVSEALVNTLAGWGFRARRLAQRPRANYEIERTPDVALRTNQL